jgi:hypothetical protein
MTNSKAIKAIKAELATIVTQIKNRESKVTLYDGYTSEVILNNLNQNFYGFKKSLYFLTGCDYSWSTVDGIEYQLVEIYSNDEYKVIFDTKEVK